MMSLSYCIYTKDKERVLKVITFENVSKVYEGEHVAVSELSMQVDEGELVVLIGPSGCGKTTTLQMVNRLVEPTGGRILVSGRDTADFDAVQLRRSMGYVIQEIGLFPHMTVAGNITIVPELQGWNRQRKQERAHELMELVGMDPDIYLDRYPRELSGGQQQRIGVLRALAVDPDILLMDEPFGALDPLTRDQLQEELTGLQHRVRKTVLFVTHDMDEALKIADRVALMREGILVQIDAPEKIQKDPADGFVSEFIGTERMIQSPLDVTVDDVMLDRIPTARHTTGLQDGLEAMREAGGDFLAIVDGQENFIGIASADRLQRARSEGGGPSKIADVRYSSGAIRPDTTLMEAVHQLADTKDGVVAVVGADGRLVGTLTRGSLPRILTDELWPVDACDGKESETES